MYLAYYTWADDPDLLAPECLLGYPHREEALYAALYVQGGKVLPKCIEGLPPEERYQAMYEAVYTAAEDDTLTHPDCFLSLSPEVRDLAFYTALYVIADNADLLSPECFLGSSREEQREALYAAVYQITQEPVDPIPPLNPTIWLRRDSILVPVDDPVPEWPDVSGNSNDAVQSSGTKQPFLTDDGPEYDGVDDFMETGATTIGDFTLMAVVSLSASGNFPVVVALDSDTHLRFFLDTGRAQFLYAAGLAITATDPIPLATKVLLCARRVVSTGAAELLVNGVSAGTATATATPTSSPVYLGSDGGASFFLPGVISEVVLFPAWLSDPDLAAVTISIATRNNIPI